MTLMQHPELYLMEVLLIVFLMDTVLSFLEMEKNCISLQEVTVNLMVVLETIQVMLALLNLA